MTAAMLDPPLRCHRAVEHGVALAWIFTDDHGGAEDAEAWLSPEEKARAAAHRQGRDRASYRAAHALKRSMIAQSLGCRPDMLVFAHGPFGKPYLPAHDRLQFSLSHCDGLAILAWCLDRPVGVDAERLPAEPFPPEMAEIAFHATERAALSAVPDPARARAQIGLWVLREAHAKGTGQGLPNQPADLAFALDPPRILHGSRQDEPWKLSLRPIGHDHLMGLAILE